MTDYSQSGVHQLNKWLWSKLNSFIWDGTNRAFVDYDGTGLVPIITPQQEPEFANAAGGPPFVTYAYTTSFVQQWFVTGELAVYTVWDSNEARLRKIHTYMVDLLKRWDWTAQDINSFPGTTFDFKEVHVVTATGPGMHDAEGGRLPATINVRYRYSNDLDSDGLRI